jgi:hypothetical protein
MLRGRSLGCAQFPARPSSAHLPRALHALQRVQSDHTVGYPGFCQSGRGAASLASQRFPLNSRGSLSTGDYTRSGSLSVSALCLRPDVIEVTHGLATTTHRGWLFWRASRQ